MRRVVITGLGVLAPNGHGQADFAAALRNGVSGIRFQPRLAELGFQCQVAGVPADFDQLRDKYFQPATLVGMDPYCVMGCIAALDAWDDAKLPRDTGGEPDWDTAISFGYGFGGVDTIGRTLVPMVNGGNVKRLGSSVPERTMGNSVSARLSGLLAIGGQSSIVSSACASGAESIVNGYWMIRDGRTTRVLAGGCDGDSPYIWAGFDAMRVLCRNSNDKPEQASRPLSATAAGFVPSAGAGALVLESLESALERGAPIYAEVIGVAANGGGHRNGGSMTAGNPAGIRRCIESAITHAGVSPHEIDLISGHLTATMADPFEIGMWREALKLPDDQFPLVNAPKSMIGHSLGAAGAVEAVACVLQLAQGFAHPSLNCENLHPQLAWCEASIPRQAVDRPLRIVAKSSFGFGDVNACLLFREASGIQP